MMLTKTMHAYSSPNTSFALYSLYNLYRQLSYFKITFRVLFINQEDQLHWDGVPFYTGFGLPFCTVNSPDEIQRFLNLYFLILD